MQNPIQTFRQSSTVFEKPRILSENLKILTSSNYRTVQYFLLKLCTCFLLTNVYKRVCGTFLFSLDLELFAKIKRPGFSTPVFYIFINNSRSKLRHTSFPVIFAKYLTKYFLQNSSEWVLLNSNLCISVICEYQSTGLSILRYTSVLICIATPRLT